MVGLSLPAKQGRLDKLIGIKITPQNSGLIQLDHCGLKAVDAQ